MTDPDQCHRPLITQLTKIYIHLKNYFTFQQLDLVQLYQIYLDHFVHTGEVTRMSNLEVHMVDTWVVSRVKSVQVVNINRKHIMMGLGQWDFTPNKVKVTNLISLL